jgi:hypothetical protein
LGADSRWARRRREYYVLFEEGHVEPLLRLRGFFENYMRIREPDAKVPLWRASIYVAALSRIKCTVGTVLLCKACGAPHIKGCCAKYDRVNRTSRKVVHNLKIVDDM